MSIINDLFAQAVEAYQAEDYTKAERLFSDVLSSDPHVSEALLNLGNVYFKMASMDKAKAFWQKAIQTNPLEAKAYFHLGNFYYSQQDYAKAIYYWQIFQKCEPKHPDVPLNLGLAYEAMKDLYQAFQHYNHYLNLNQLGTERFKLKERIQQLKVVADHNFKQAEKFMQQGLLKDAKEAYEQSIAVYPINPKGPKHFGAVLYQLGEYTASLEWYEKALRQSPKDVGIVVNLGILYERLDKPFKALWAYSEANRMLLNRAPKPLQEKMRSLWKLHGPQALEVTLNKINTLLQEEAFLEAEDLVKKYVELASHLAPDKASAGQAILDDLKLKQDPKKYTAVLSYALAEEAKKQNQLEKAIAMYHRFLMLDPLHKKAKQIREQLKELEAVVAAVSNSPVALTGSSTGNMSAA